jgi:hypothetical protein
MVLFGHDPSMQDSLQVEKAVHSIRSMIQDHFARQDPNRTASRSRPRPRRPGPVFREDLIDAAEAARAACETRAG